MDKKITDIAKKYKMNLESYGVPVEGVYLFGSFAKGTENKWSDIDLGIVSPMFGVDSISDRVFLMRIRDNETKLVEPHPISLKTFNDASDLLVRNIKKGIKIN